MREAVRLALARRAGSIYPTLFRIAYSPNRSQFSSIKVICGAIHLLQVSTFVIDDFLDDSESRNGRPTLTSKYGPKVAVAVGEILQSVALRYLSQSVIAGDFKNKPAAHRLIVRIPLEVYLGQFADLVSSGNLNWTPSDYLRTISRTTARFLSSTARSAALLAGRPSKHCSALGRFGYLYGTAVQIVDDILDVATDSEVMGKPAATDLKNKRMRLPYILALRSGHKSVAEAARSHFMNDSAGAKDALRVMEVLKGSEVLQDCARFAGAYIQAAREAVEPVDDGRSLLNSLCDSLTNTLEYSTGSAATP